ncbi:uroporphyrinogen decarboxylase Hem12 [Schizosaccharomyces octosporus yFS286]|uniref:Uroporphyrinogen decarboxylase n=1 Tax=Schizosaccharomyces octosporus (strain yFS286) TaxID=483514 RepID=S9R9X1_SCHOY|nr:uroporphyrinogen decarboxylase Hem12 [Schizosaccharomyces octosporus yFS286]EPX70939.1 uroporphyrinogen decarboxylase Hem12 [Schizosaccharomyces octosporus yFS286]
MYPSMKNDLILRAARGETVERPPVWIMRQAGRYLPEYHRVRSKQGFFEMCQTPETSCELTLQPINRFDGLLDAAIIFSDILVIPQALGMQVVMLEQKGPHFPEPLATPEDLEKLEKVPNIPAKLGYVMDAISLTRENLDGRVPLLGFSGAPWTIVAYMIEGGGSKTFTKAKSWLFRYPEASHRLLNMVTEATIVYLTQQVYAGAQMLQIFDSWAGELSPKDFFEFSYPYLVRICEGVKKELSKSKRAVPMIVFPKGAWYALDKLCDSGYDVIGLDWTVDPKEAVRIRGDRRVTFQGNLDPNILYGGREIIEARTKEMIEGFNGGKQGYIINLGHGVTPGVNPDDVRFFLEQCHKYGSQK